MDKLLLNIFASLLAFVCVIFAIANSAIKYRKFICNRYILNTYLNARILQRLKDSG